MRFPYLVGRSSVPLPSRGGGRDRPRPITAVRVTGPTGNRLRDCQLDTGADDTVFPEGVASKIGVDLSAAAAIRIQLAGRGPISCRFAPVQLRLSDGTETFEWTATVAFAPVALVFSLLGYAGFFEYFDVDFHGAAREVIITPAATFPGRRI